MQSKINPRSPHEIKSKIVSYCMVSAKILVLCVRGFLRDTLQGVEHGHLPARGWLGAVNRLVKLVKSAHGRKAAKKFGIHWPDLLPLKEIAACKDPKIVSFRDQQMLRGFSLASPI
jgi:hypothetical protein